MKKKLSFVKPRRIYFLGYIVILVICFLFLNGDSLFQKFNFFNNSTQEYVPMQYEIGSHISKENNNYPFSNVYSLSGSNVTEISNEDLSNKVLIISTAQDLYAFSQLCLKNDKFLGYSYKLMSNIDYSNQNPFIPIAWKSEQTFSGVFDGNGFEISNLSLPTILDDTTYIDMEYYAMFSRNSGIIQNLGLIDANLIINVQNYNDIGVATLCGSNNGIIKNVYVIDLRDPIEDESGISASGEYQIAGLVFENANELSNAYTAYNIVSNYTITDYISFREVYDHETKEATSSNLYYYNASIENYEIIDDKEVVTYNQGLIGKQFEREIQATYCESLEDLCLKFENISGWYTNNSYDAVDVKTAINIKTPILRGLQNYNEDNHNFAINNLEDFIYIFELININPLFASSDFTYTITADIDLANIPESSYAYDSFFSANLIGVEDDNLQSLKDVLNQYSNYPTIYNASIKNTIVNDGIECYGVIPWLTGSIKNLNFYFEDDISNFKENDPSISLKSVGLVSGLVEGGIIDNVNVFGNLNFDTPNMGRFYAGGICGILAENAYISNSTTAGAISCSIFEPFSSISQSGYIDGISLGGAIGYSTNNGGNIDTVLSAMNINSCSFTKDTNINQAVGGVLGSGYTLQAEKLSNKGTITIGHENNDNGIVYAAGVIGKHLGMNTQVSSFYNQGSFDIYANDNYIYVSGISNVSLITTSGSLPISNLKDNNGKSVYWANSFTNAANFNILNGSANLTLASIAYLESDNGFMSSLSGMYNVSYYQAVENNSIVTRQLSDQIISMSKLAKYSGGIINNSSSFSNLTSLNKIYNLKNVNFEADNSITINTMNYSGCVLGKYINLSDVRNEGDITVNLNSSASNASRNIYISGVFSELSPSCIAQNIYNGGNIHVFDNSSSNLYLNIYISGICTYNYSEITDSKYNPLSFDFDSSTTGSLDKVINNGDIYVTSSNLNVNYNVNDNNQNYNSKLYGNVYASGIVYLNSGILTNCFNTGDIEIDLYAKSVDYSFKAAGICYYSQGQNAKIRDSANNGNIKIISLGTNSNNVCIGGIIGEIEQINNNLSQVVAFTINYGELYAFNACSNSTIDTSETATKAGGILASGLCNIINTVNYGNVYSTESAGGMIGTINLSSITISSKSIIANTLNYGNIKAINRYLTVNGAPVYATYNQIKNNDEINKYINYGFTAQPFYQSIGALVGVIDYANRDLINIRYLINFFENVQIVCKEINVPTNISTDVSKLVNVTPNYKFLGQNVTYAPLSTVSDENGNIGVFSKDFMLRKAMAGENLDQTEVTDSYIGDFFQFIPFDKINTNILDLIGWRTIAYLDASERFAKDLNIVSNLLGLTGTNLIDNALNSYNWLNTCDETIIMDLTTKLLDNTNSNLKDIISYVFYESSNSSLITMEYRQAIVDAIISYLDENEDYDFANLLKNLMYDDLMASIIAKDEMAYQDILNIISNYLDQLSTEDLAALLQQYLSLLQDTSDTSASKLFDNNKYYESRYDLLNDLLDTLNNDTLQAILSSLSGNDDSIAKYLAYLEDNSGISRQIYQAIIANNSIENNESFLNVVNEAFKKYGILDYVSSQIDNNISADFSSVDNLNGQNITSLQITPTKDYTQIWNAVKNDSNFINYLNNYVLTNVVSVDGNSGLGIYAKATEYTNTYQSNDSPSSTSGSGVPSTSGKLRAESYNETISTRFIYTPDSVVSSSTYYYGPYQNASNSIWWPNNNPGNYNQGFDLYTTGEEGATSVRYVPIFISLDSEFLQSKINGSSNSTLYEFYWNNTAPQSNNVQGGDSKSQWVSTHIIDKAPDDGHHYLLKDYRNKDYIVNYYDFDPTFTRTSNSEYATSNKINNNLTLRLTTNSSQATGQHVYRDYYLKSYCSASLITGIWYQQNIWYQNGLMGAFLTSKDGEYINGYRGVITTSYINYFLDDLLKLDGILTKGRGNDVISNDEKNIINAIMTKVLSDKTGSDIVVKAMAQVASNGITSQQDDISNILLDYVSDTEFSNNFVKNTIISLGNNLNNINYSWNESLDEHLDTLIADRSWNNKQQIIFKSVNSLENFRKVLLYELNSNNVADILPKNSIITLMPINFDIFTKLPEEDLKQILLILGTYDYKSSTDSIFSKLINLNEGYYKDILTLICSELSSAKVDTITKLMTNYNDIQKTYYLAAYLGNDFLINYEENSLLNSELYSILEDYENGKYNFITSNTEIDSDVFIELMELLGFDLTTEGYGIYALSSGKGILNGQFIPDNLGLATMDSNYELIDGKYWQISEENSSDWRGGTNENMDPDGVTYAFVVEMKQLKLSISTTIFELDLISGNDILYSSSDLIDLENFTITYYIPTSYKDKEFSVNNIVIAEGAKYFINEGSIFKYDQIGKITVTAEDPTVVSEYDVKFIIRDMSFNASKTLDNVTYAGGNININVTSPDAGIVDSTPLPLGLDLSPYIYIESGDAKLLDSFEFLIPPIVDENGSCIISLYVKESLPYGDYNIVIALPGYESNSNLIQKIPFTKEASPNNYIESILFDGNTYVIGQNQSSISNDILFGRCYDYDELTNMQSSNFYLTDIKVSYGATIEIEATKNEIDNIITYDVIYTITAENGNSRQYNHILTEKAPSSDYIIYKNGKVDTNSSYVDNVITTTFYRGEDPNYRIKYNIDNFYNEGKYFASLPDNVNSYLNVDYEALNSILSISFAYDADAGEYEFNFTYSNSGLWLDNEYVKNYSFSSVMISKLYSIDATLKKVTFLDTNQILGSLATVMYPDYAILPQEGVSYADNNERSYQDLKGQGQSDAKIFVDSKGINYVDSQGVDYSTRDNFYIVGSLANAELSNYAPTFKIEEHAEVYQYTTLNKLTKYGEGFQNASDTSILNTQDSDDLYIYVPYVEKESGSIEIFLIQLTNGIWNNVYPSNYNGVGDPLLSLTSNKADFTYNGHTYEISEMAGKPTNNESLFMDYIGTPLENHFWFVSYVVFSEDYVRNQGSNNLKFYHIALIDTTNTIFFDIMFKTSIGFEQDSIFFNVLGNQYSNVDGDNVHTSSCNISAFSIYDSTVNNEKYYHLDKNLQVLPQGYFYFYINLPQGYTCSYEITNNKKNQNANVNEPGAYLPPTSIVTQRIEVLISITEAEGGIVWGESTSNISFVKAIEKS